MTHAEKRRARREERERAAKAKQPRAPRRKAPAPAKPTEWALPPKGPTPAQIRREPTVLDRLVALVEYLEECGRRTDAKRIKGEIARLRYRTFPDRPDVGYERFRCAYEDAQQGIRQEETERARERGTTSDPTLKGALREISIGRVDEQLEEIWERHAEQLDLPGRGRASARVWRDQEERERVADLHSQAENDRTREAYPGDAA